MRLFQPEKVVLLFINGESRYSRVALRCTPLDSGGGSRLELVAMFTVYVIYNAKAKKTYTGQTEDINRRMKEHNDHTFASFTSRYQGKWKLIYKESVATRSEALTREKQLKSHQGRVYLSQFIPS